MKVLITGMTSRQANSKSSKRDVTMAWLLTEALRDAGCEVEHRDPLIGEEVDKEFDHAFVGLGPLHGMGTNRSYGSLAVILRMWGAGKLTLFIDDADAGKIVGGIRTVLGDPDKRFTKDFFQYKKEWAIAKEEPYRSWLLSGVQMLNDYEWPRLLYPAFPWAKEDQLAKMVPNAVRTTSIIDLSAYLPTFKLKDREATERAWISEDDKSGKWFRMQRPTIPVMHLGRVKEGDDDTTSKRPHDDKLVQLYHDYWGVINENPESGWWTSRMGYAVQAETLYITRWQSVESLGQAFALLPDQAAQMDEKLRHDWVTAQAEAFKNFSASKEQVKDTLSALLNPATEMVAS